MSPANVSKSNLCAAMNLITEVELNQLSGIAAILTFPLDVEVVEAEEREAKEQEQRLIEEQNGTNDEGQ